MDSRWGDYGGQRHIPGFNGQGRQALTIVGEANNPGAVRQLRQGAVVKAAAHAKTIADRKSVV